MDNFEKQIREQRAQFDKAFANKEKLWTKIDAGIQTPTKKPGWKRIGLLTIFILVVSLFIYKMMNKTTPEAQQYAMIQKQELLQIDHHYGKLVSFQIEKLRGAPQLDDAEKEDFMKYINYLSQEQIELKNELNNNIDNQEVLEAIIQNFQQQVNLISELLDRIDQSKETSNEGISL